MKALFGRLAYCATEAEFNRLNYFRNEADYGELVVTRDELLFLGSRSSYRVTRASIINLRIITERSYSPQVFIIMTIGLVAGYFNSIKNNFPVDIKDAIILLIIISLIAVILYGFRRQWLELKAKEGNETIELYFSFIWRTRSFRPTMIWNREHEWLSNWINTGDISHLYKILSNPITNNES